MPTSYRLEYLQLDCLIISHYTLKYQKFQSLSTDILNYAVIYDILNIKKTYEVTNMNIQKIRCVDYHIISEKIPSAFDGFRILHLSDYHNHPVPGLLEAISKQNPDIIAITGDMINEHEDYQPVIPFLESLLTIAPCYMVSGNHDTWHLDYREYVRTCREKGAIFLQNERICLERNGAQIFLSGMEDVFCKTQKGMEEKLEEAFSALGKIQAFDILLFHRANLLDAFSGHGFDLVLAGHLHGGQIRLPIVGGVLAPKSGLAANARLLFPDYTGGKYRLDETTTAIVSRGTGNATLLPRMFNPPEIGVISLHAN